MRQSGLLLDDNRDVSEACVTRPLIEIGSVGEFSFNDIDCFEFYAVSAIFQPCNFGTDIEKYIYFKYQAIF